MMSQDSHAEFWGRFWGTVILGIGVLLLLQTLELIPWKLWEFAGPFLLIAWGILIIRKPLTWCCFPYRVESKERMNTEIAQK